MKLYDFDGMFDKKLTDFISANVGKYTESEWEDIIPRLYKKFGDTPIKSVGDTPNGFYAKMTDEELVKALCTHLKQGVPVSEFLCKAIEGRNAVKLLLPLLDGSEQEREYAVNLIGSADCAIQKYMDMLVSPDCGEELKNSLVDFIKEKADLAAQRAVEYYERGVEREFMLEIMSRSVVRSDKIFDILIKEFRGDSENVPMHASYLAAYGDERALEYLLDKIDEDGISFIEYKELLLAIESLGGTYDKQRDFSNDPYYAMFKTREVSATDIFGGADGKKG